MCWKCDNPDRTDDDYFDELRRDIAEHGWIVQFVDDAKRPFAYTIGLHDRGLPELLVTGLDAQTSQDVLNACAGMMCDGSVFRPGETVGLGDDWLLMIVKVDHPGAHLNFAFAVEGQGVRALQLVWADNSGRWPWDPSPFRDTPWQAVLGLRPKRRPRRRV